MRLGGAIFDIGRGLTPRAMRAAEEATADFHPVAYDSALAVLANRRDGLNCALEAVEGVPHVGRNYFETLVVVVSANFTSWL
jgi:hypothetical protein